MEKNVAKENVNASIRGFKLERQTEVLEILNFNTLSNTYSAFAPQFAALCNSSNAFAVAAGGIALFTSANYLALCKIHYTAKKIEELRRIRNELDLGINSLEEISQEEYDNLNASYKSLCK